MAKRIAAILAVYVLLAGCASKENANYQREGVQYGTTKGVFHGRWWNYYERGSSYLSGKYYAEAMSDLRQALAGRGADTWRARTYGLHFVEYFPNRELGVAYFEQGNLEEAERYLRDTDMPLGQLSGALGFSEQSALSRACRRWFSASPSELRRASRGSG